MERAQFLLNKQEFSENRCRRRLETSVYQRNGRRRCIQRILDEVILGRKRKRRKKVENGREAKYHTAELCTNGKERGVISNEQTARARRNPPVSFASSRFSHRVDRVPDNRGRDRAGRNGIFSVREETRCGLRKKDINIYKYEYI